jgi:RNA polymerase sigma-70 factor (ECF subfamily)
MTLAKSRSAPWAHANGPDLPGSVSNELRRDRETLTATATQLLPRVRNLIRYLIHGDQDVDDIAQEALVAVLRGLPSYRSEGSLESWADRVVARVTFAWLRRRKPGRTTSFDVEPEVADGDTTPPDEYLRRRRLVALLDRLPHEQRYALVLHHVVGLSVEEIAVDTASKTETVRTRLRLGKRRLRELADPNSTDGDAAHE